jgi:hypothetical protein
MHQCPICREPADYQPMRDDRLEWRCERCGNFIITGTATQILENRRSRIDSKKLSQIVHAERRDFDGYWFCITEGNIDELLSKARITPE